MGSYLPNQGSNPHLLLWKCGVPTTEPPGRPSYYFQRSKNVSWWYKNIFLKVFKVLQVLKLASVLQQDRSYDMDVNTAWIMTVLRGRVRTVYPEPLSFRGPSFCVCWSQPCLASFSNLTLALRNHLPLFQQLSLWALPLCCGLFLGFC